MKHLFTKIKTRYMIGSRINFCVESGKEQNSSVQLKEHLVRRIIKKVFLLLFSFAASSILQPSLAQPQSAWKTIFNGKSLEGWTVTGGAGKVRVENGCIVLNMKANTSEHTFVHTNNLYKNFIFEADCKRDSSFYYGILFRARPAADTAHVRLNGYQVKIDHSSRHWTGGIFDDFGTAWNWLYTLEEDKRAQQAEKSVGEWEHWRIEAIGNNIKVWLNGVPVTNMINNKYDRGFIAFKIHFLGNDSSKEKASAWFKNVRIIDVNPGKYALKMDIPAKEITSPDQ